MEEKVFNFSFTFPQINVVLNALKKLPFEQSADIINKVIIDYETQVKKEAEDKKEKPESKE